EEDPAALELLAEVEDLEVGDAAAPGSEVVRRPLRVELVPHDQAGLLQHVVGIDAARQEGQDVGVQPPLRLQEQAAEEPALRRAPCWGPPLRRESRSGPAGGGGRGPGERARGDADAGVVAVFYLEVDAGAVFGRGKREKAPRLPFRQRGRGGCVDPGVAGGVRLIGAVSRYPHRLTVRRPSPGCGRSGGGWR